jgi:hypothetical protein
MGKIQVLTKEHELVLDEVAKESFFTEGFYFTGGTALSAAYLEHRESADLDFFNFHRFNTQAIATFLTDCGNKHHFQFTSEFLDPLYVCYLTFENGIKLKVDFSYYPYKQIETPIMFHGVKTDSLLDIAVNKMQTVTQRSEVKDFVDLYYLLQRFSFWDLREGVRIKFNQELEPMIFGSDLLISEDFTFLPNMYKPLTLDELKDFFRRLAKHIGREGVEE